MTTTWMTTTSSVLTRHAPRMQLQKTNSCPLCRFELETLDAEYEARRKQRDAADADADADADDGGLARMSAPIHASIYR